MIMAKGKKLDHPFTQFNFLVEMAEGKTSRVVAGFQECSSLNLDKPTGSIALKRGVIARKTFDELRNKNHVDASQTITIRLQNEGRRGVQMSWRLLKAHVTRFSSAPQESTDTDVAMEEMILAYERLQIDE